MAHSKKFSDFSGMLALVNWLSRRLNMQVLYIHGKGGTGEHWFHTAEQMAFLDAWILS